MIVTVRSVWMVQVPLHQIVHVVSMRHGLMPAVGPMDVIGLVCPAVVVRCTSILVCFARLQLMFVNVVSVNMVQMAVVEIIGMAIVLDGRVATIGAMDMGMPFMFSTGFGHGSSPLREVCSTWHQASEDGRAIVDLATLDRKSP